MYRPEALLVVDVQKDFLPGGALGVPGSEAIVPIINGLVERYGSAGCPLVFSRDWHPAGHASFEEQGGPWPPHCIQGTEGAEFAPGMAIPPEARILDTADHLDHDAYSAFQETDLGEYFRKQGVGTITICGLVTEICVRATVLGALEEGFDVLMLPDASRGVNLNEGDEERALGEMALAGAVLCPAERLPEPAAPQ
ncbi:MAG: isochorismatase family protein [Synergistales bacterium]|nr:isochorismatase family protein [Synergistales bacterium]